MKKIIQKLLAIKILRPLTLSILGAQLITYLLIAYVFNLEM